VEIIKEWQGMKVKKKASKGMKKSEKKNSKKEKKKEGPVTSEDTSKKAALVSVRKILVQKVIEKQPKKRDLVKTIPVAEEQI
jgi:hypothetical protein